ncbi:MAG: PAS domain-containing protein, partial [Bacteroidia bacterium]|nr:PAS domain-containing protein [Bacteroidia bacterium]
KKTYTGILPKSDGYVAVGVDLTPFAADPLLWERSLYGPNPFAQISDESLRQDHKKLVEALQTVRDLADEHKKNWEHAQQTIALMEAAARDARHKIRALDAAALVSVTDPDGFIVEINDYFSSLTRFDESSIVGKRHNVMRSPQTPDELFDELWQTIVSGRDWRGILQNLDADGRPIWLQTTIHPVVDEEGKIEKYISIQFDATETIELLIAARDEVEKQRAEIYDYRKKIARLTREIRALKHKLERFAGPQNAATAQEEPTPANAPQENSSAVAKTYLLDAEMKDRFEYCLAVGNYDALEEWAENVRNPELAQEVFDILDRLEYHRLNELFRRLQAV